VSDIRSGVIPHFLAAALLGYLDEYEAFYVKHFARLFRQNRIAFK
jgi:hypothetical protein